MKACRPAASRSQLTALKGLDVGQWSTCTYNAAKVDSMPVVRISLNGIRGCLSSTGHYAVSAHYEGNDVALSASARYVLDPAYGTDGMSIECRRVPYFTIFGDLGIDSLRSHYERWQRLSGRPSSGLPAKVVSQ